MTVTFSSGERRQAHGNTGTVLVISARQGTYTQSMTKDGGQTTSPIIMRREILTDLERKIGKIFLLRKFVFENRTLDARDIYAMLLEQHERGVEDFGNIGKVDLKMIQNIKEQLAGQEARKTLESVLPRELSTVDDRQFLVFQDVQPVILIFATEESRARICQANTCVIVKLPITGPTLKNVYSIYTMSGGAVIPAMWVMFDELGTEMAWIQVKLLLEDKNGQGCSLTRMWIVPFSRKYLQI